MSFKVRITVLVVVAAAILAVLPFILIGADTDESTKLLPGFVPGDDANPLAFGKAVSLDGGVAVIGSPEDDYIDSDAGSAHIFRWDGIQTRMEVKLTALDAAAGDQFGYSVGIDADTVIVGAPFDDATSTNSGAAYIYEWNGSNWEQETKLCASDDGANDLFGWSVAVDADVAVVGAFLWEGSNTDQGAAYVFRWNATTSVWA